MLQMLLDWRAVNPAAAKLDLSAKENHLWRFCNLAGTS
jgi:hypothetical protein